jgi:hypothetical protein
MNIKRLKQLKQKLIKEKDLSEIWLFYMDHFADHEEFTELGQAVQHNYLNTVLVATCQQLFRKKITITNFLLIHLAEYQFYHGPFDVEGHMGSVIFFEDIKMGMLAVSAPFPTTKPVTYSRFSEPIRLSTSNRNDLN